MWIISSIITIFLAYLAENNYNKKGVYKLFLFLIVIVNTIIWGLRDIGVGTDTLNYIDSYFNAAKSLTSFNDFFSVYTDNFDKGYLLLAYLSSLFGEESNSLMFFTELFIMSFVVMGLYELKQKYNYSITEFMFFFVVLYQIHVINLMRQFCAISLLFWGYTLLLQNKYILWLVCQICAYYFHSTSIIFITIPFAYILMNTTNTFKSIYLYIVIGIALSFTIFNEYILSFLGNNHLVKDTYIDVYGKYSQFSAGSNRITFYIKNLLLLTIIYLLYKNKNNKKEVLYVLFLTFCLNFCFLLSNYVLTSFARLSHYFYFMFITYLVIAVKQQKKTIKSLYNIFIGISIFSFLRELYTNYYGDYDDYNYLYLVYKSQILGIE